MFVSCCNGPLSSTGETPTFQSSEVTSLLLGTSCPPSRMQWRSTSWVELELLFSFRFQILAVESPELRAAESREGYFQHRQGIESQEMASVSGSRAGRRALRLTPRPAGR